MMLKTGVVFVAGILLNGWSLAQVDHYLAGEHYLEITPPLAVDYATGQTAEVWVFFKYGCPACYQFHPYLQAWQATLDEKVVVKKIPVFQPELYSKAYYAAEWLGLSDPFHLAVYRRLHQDKQPFRSLEDFAELAAEQGADAREFMRMANSFAVNARLNQDIRKAGQAQVPGTPIMVVDGRYLLSGKLVGSNAAMLEVADYLLAREKAIDSKQDSRHGQQP